MADEPPDVSDGSVRVTRREHVLEVVLDRPHRKNALTAALWRGLESALDRVEKEDGITVLALRGEGGDFCAGGDLQMLASGNSHATGSGRHVLELLEREQAIVRRLVEAPVLTVALIEGAAVGGGFDLCMACDLRIATPDAKLGAVYVRRGLVPDLGALFLLQRTVHHPVAARLALTGELISGREAYELGVVQRLAEDGDVERAAEQWFDAAAAAQPYAMRRCKKALVRPHVIAGLRQATEMAATQAILLGESEFAEALDAFLDSRRPTD